uniref:Putative secreted protein n=1 Tax=Anopheles darlingi TaxID=43151 RepID=A0A2M4DF11_ANODA
MVWWFVPVWFTQCACCVYESVSMQWESGSEKTHGTTKPQQRFYMCFHSGRQFHLRNALGRVCCVHPP